MPILNREGLVQEFNLPVLPHRAPCSGVKAQPHGQEIVNTPARITFVRNRMLYARAALNAKGTIRFGLRHIRT
jgi:hypothetical protein